MKSARIERGSLLPQIETLFIYARGLAALGIVLWLFFSPPRDPSHLPIKILLILFSLHLGAFFLATTRHWTSRTNIYWGTLLFDVFFVTVLVRFTGGVDSEFFLLYFLSVGFGAYYLGMNSGLLLSFVVTLNYLLTNSQAIPNSFFGDLLLRLAMLWFFAAATGYVSEFFRHAEEKLLRTLNTLNERTAELEKAHTELETVYETARTLGEHNEPDRIVNELLNISLRILGYQHLGVLFFNQERNGLLLAARMEMGQTHLLKPPMLFDLSGISGYVARTGRPQRLFDISTDDRYQPGLTGAKSEMAVPMISRGRTIGVLNAESVELGAFSEKDEKILTVLAGSAAMAYENARLQKQLEDLSTTDELTGVHNFRYFNERFRDEERRARRYDQPLSLIMVDLDWFKNCNDTYGHQAGNLVLRGIARIIKTVVRDTDIVCRYGGEEFIIILPQTLTSDAREIGERIRSEVERSEFAEEGLSKNVHVTVSVGISTYPENGGTAERLIDLVDRALYQAKGQGKNRVCTT
jgi:diguanylate cyclase (GGDEF)-like protein